MVRRHNTVGIAVLLAAWLAAFVLPAGAIMQAPAAPPDASEKYDPATFAAELRRLDAALRQTHGSRDALAAIRTHLPAKWEVDSPDRSYQVSTEPLRTLLLDAERNPTQQNARTDEAKTWIGHLATQVRDYSAAQSLATPDARSKLDKILGQREFGAVRPPNAWDQLKQRLDQWLLRMFGKLFAQISRHPMGAKVLFWLIISAVVAWLAWMIFRFWGGRARVEELEAIGHVAVHRSWQEWIRAAREAAARGDFREAVHSVYWASITHLEDIGVVAVDRTRTPREYLRLVGESDGGPIAEQKKRRELLAALTSRLERIWYGLRPARVEDFQDSMRQVEELGCRLP